MGRVGHNARSVARLPICQLDQCGEEGRRVQGFSIRNGGVVSRLERHETSMHGCGGGAEQLHPTDQEIDLFVRPSISLPE